MSPDDFAQRLGAPTPTPGGGAAAARVGLYACALLRMVTGITLKRIVAGRAAAAASLDEERIRAALLRATELAGRFERLEAEDIAAFEAFLEAGRMPRSTPAETSAREQARRQAALHATAVPMSIVEAALEVLRLAREILDLSRTTPLRAESDLHASVELAAAAARVGGLNIQANLPLVPEDEAAGVRQRWAALRRETDALVAGMRDAPGSETPA